MPDTEQTAAAPLKRPRGRPPKKRAATASQRPEDSKCLEDSQSSLPSTPSPPTSSSRPGGASSAPFSQNRVDMVKAASSSSISLKGEPKSFGSKRSSPDSVEDSSATQSIKRMCLESADISNEASPSTKVRKPRPTILPARRSARQATVQSTQISEGTLRPTGPPHLEAALSIALRNLESETWCYLWSYYKNHPGDPLPTPADIKEACPCVRKAAEAVDKADRELEDAIDDIMEAAASKKRRGGPKPAERIERPDSEEVMSLEPPILVGGVGLISNQASRDPTSDLSDEDGSEYAPR